MFIFDLFFFQAKIEVDEQTPVIEKPPTPEPELQVNVLYSVANETLIMKGCYN